MTTPPPLPAKYVPADHEPAISARWDAADAFHADPTRVTQNDAQPYAILIPPPNVTGALHLGHALNNTLQDILVRAHRMKGFETLWMPGTDHAGIATQSVVDKRLKTEGQPALADYKKIEAEGGDGRTPFIEKVQSWKDEYEERITTQLKAMGASCDWQRQRFTMDPVCARAVREAFFRLFRDGLIYRGKRLVNWDPVTQTALADDEVESVEIEGIFAYLRYPLVAPASLSPAGAEGRGEGATSSLASSDFRPVTWSELAARGYPGAADHPDDDQAFVTVATTRPETYLGDTAVAMNPADPRAKSLHGMHAELPLVGRVIPIITDDYVVLPVSLGGDENDPKARMATGFLKVTPAHDPNDYDIGQRHDLEQINVMAPDASISPDHGWADYDPHSGAHVFVGLSREDARQKVLDEFKARGLLEAVKPHTHAVGHSYRSHAPVEPYLSDQWYVRVTDDRLKGAALRAMAPDQRTSSSLSPAGERAGVRGTPPSTAPSKDNPHDGTLRFHPDRYAKTFESWHDNLRDWCISRQLWWGHRIPVWTISNKTLVQDGHLDTLESKFTGAFHYITSDAEWDAQIATICAQPNDELEAFLESIGATQDPDVLDTWFSSALWPLSTLGWPDPEAAAADTGLTDFGSMLEAFNPTSVLCTAREIITLWVSRMVMFNRYLLSPSPPRGEGGSRSESGEGRTTTDGQLPFRDVFIHAMIQDGEGRKMSKSLGNGVDPRDIIHSHGADAMRFVLCEMTTQTQDVRMPVEMDPTTGKNTSPKFDKGRNLASKLFNATKFVCMMLDDHPDENGSDTVVRRQHLQPIDRWMLARLTQTVTRINEALSRYEFSVVGASLYELLWKDFCDWYLEGVKPTIRNSPAQRIVLQQTLETILRLAHPVMPFITETLFEQIRARRRGSLEGLTLPPNRNAGRTDELLCLAGWPILDATLDDHRAVSAFERAQRFIEAIRQVRAQHQVPPRRRITLHADADMVAQLAGLGQVTETLAGLDQITTDAATDHAVAFTFDGVEHRLTNLADAIDTDAERERLNKLIDDLSKSLAALDKRLSNPGYTEKAPKHLVDETRAQRDQQAADLQAARDRLGSLG
ncbi:MAG: valine--tRNA ligase [Phycisphaerales bacterium]